MMSSPPSARLPLSCGCGDAGWRKTPPFSRCRAAPRGEVTTADREVALAPPDEGERDDVDEWELDVGVGAITEGWDATAAALPCAVLCGEAPASDVLETTLLYLE